MARKTTKITSEGGGQPQLIALAKPQAALRAGAENTIISIAGASTDPTQKVLDKYKAVLKPLFGPTEERVTALVGRQAAEASAPLAELSGFYKVQAEEKDLEKIQKDLLDGGLFDAAYIKPGTEDPVEINTMTAVADPAPSSTPDFTARQIYLNAAPEGINARWAWQQAGGRGHGVHIIDIENAWRFTHEDLLEKQGGLLGGDEFITPTSGDHGTAVLGEYGGDVNGFGVTGISPNAITSAVSHRGLGSAGAINHAATRLVAGDVMLLEMHRPGPRHNFQWRQDQKGYIAVEWWPDDYAAILNATRRGIIVVEAAGNGAEDLDDAIYDTRPLGFPADWTNPFRRNNRDSGAIVVGAGAPPPGTHGRDHGPDRSRLGFSNYGALIDAQGWGREVTTCGYGDLQGGDNADLWYTDRFSGTSSASPIVTGAIACLQGMAKARGRAVFNPMELREALRTTGSPQQDAPGRPRTQRIGNRPDLPPLAQHLFPAGGNKRGIAFRRSVEQWRPLEMRAFIDISPQLTAAHTTGVLQAALVSAQSLSVGTADLDELGILFRVSALSGQAVEIAGPVGGDRYRYWGIIAADGLGRLFVDEGFSSTGSDKCDLIAEIQGVDRRFVFDDALQRYREV
ncbi:MAG: S8 family serine peptidase [Ahrensia sp.]|nr:S8 family serine peptidase [Ahrensia sp.]